MDTPFLESALEKAYSTRKDVRIDRFIRAKATLMLALQEKTIYNVQLQEAKGDLSLAAEIALEKASTIFWEKYRDSLINGRNSTDPRFEVTRFVQLNQASALLKKLAKAEQSPELQQYTEILAEVAGIWKMVKEVSPYVVKGRRPSSKPTRIDLTNTGICGICEGRFKLHNDVLVEHGFKISAGDGRYFGTRVGRCFGVGYQPYELSCDSNLEYANCLRILLSEREKYLVQLKAGEIQSFSIKVKLYWEKVAPNDKRYQEVLKRTIESTEREIDHIKYDILHQDKRVATWSPPPLKYGK